MTAMFGTFPSTRRPPLKKGGRGDFSCPFGSMIEAKNPPNPPFCEGGQAGGAG